MTGRVPLAVAIALADDTVRVAAGRGAPLTLANVWATWCTSCREETADLEAMQRDFGARGGGGGARRAAVSAP